MNKRFLVYVVMVILVTTLLSWSSMFASVSNSGGSGYRSGSSYSGSGGGYSGGGGHK